MRSPWLRVEWSVFLLLVGSYAFFWHSRDWNTASRLILTYAMADRGTVCLDGLDRQTGDIALFQGHYYCDKLPGFSLLAMAPYRLARAAAGLPAHPLKSAAKDYWPADYWVTLGTSGLFTAITAVLLVRLARDMGCSPRCAALVGLAYGLATPAYVYATLAYGHQLSAFALTASFYLLSKRGTGREAVAYCKVGLDRSCRRDAEMPVVLRQGLAGPPPTEARKKDSPPCEGGVGGVLGWLTRNMLPGHRNPPVSPLRKGGRGFRRRLAQEFQDEWKPRATPTFHHLGAAARFLAAGLLAAYAAVTELQVGPASAILGLYLLVQCLRRRRRPGALACFAIGAAVPTLVLLAYNMLAFGSPWEMGYFHHATAQFAKVHNRQNPLGLRMPDPTLLIPLFWGEYRGLLFYAPILVLAFPGWLLLAARRRFDMAAVSLAIAAAVFVVNLSYPEWTGGWSTGPRLLVPLLPFAMIPVAAVLAGRNRWSYLAAWLATALALAGGVLILLFQGVGARIPQDVDAPLRAMVWPLWTGRAALPTWWTGQRFTASVAAVLARDWEQRLRASRQALQFLPLVVAQLLAIVAIYWTAREGSPGPGSALLNLGVDEKQKSGRADQDTQDPEAKPHRVDPDTGP